MAIPGVYQTDKDGNIGREYESFPAEAVCGMLFDISADPTFWTTHKALATKAKDAVVELNSYDDIEALGITGSVLGGVVKHYLDDFTKVAGNNGFRLFISFADCSKGNWKPLLEMQKAAAGVISQFAVWTEQALWSENEDDDFYTVNLVTDIERVMENMAVKYYSPAVVGLCANTAKIGTGTAVNLDKLPNLKKLNCRYVSVLLGQESSSAVHSIQDALTSKTPVGSGALMLGLLSRLKVSQSIGWVQQCNLGNHNVTQCEMGFGDVANGNYGKYESFEEDTELDALHQKGYIFLRKFMGFTGVFFSANHTCSDTDYCTITRNRTINKSRRLVRASLLPYVNSPIKVDPATGQMHAATISIFKDKVSNNLEDMRKAEEISGIGTIVLNPAQNVLKTDIIKLSYTIVPFGESQEIHVEEGFVVSQ